MRLKNVLKLVSLKDNTATVQYEVPEKEIPDLFDFNPVQQRYSLIREASFETKDPSLVVRRMVKESGDASIINTLSHEPKDKEYRIVMYDGVPFIDNFGLHVYIKSTIVWSKRSDVDTRFNSNIYPHRIMEPEFWFLFKEDDLRDR